MGLFEAAEAGDPVARQVVEKLLDDVGMALVAMGAIVDPALVILDGPVGCSLEPYVPTLAATLARRPPRAPRLVDSRLPGDSTLLGAVAAALELARRRSAPSALFGAFSISGGAHGMSQAIDTSGLRGHMGAGHRTGEELRGSAGAWRQRHCCRSCWPGTSSSTP